MLINSCLSLILLFYSFWVVNAIFYKCANIVMYSTMYINKRYRFDKLGNIKTSMEFELN